MIIVDDIKNYYFSFMICLEKYVKYADIEIYIIYYNHKFNIYLLL